MGVYRDFKELLESFNAEGVDYLVIGGYALAHHGAPRYTRDIDLYVRPSEENAARIMAALNAFGFGEIGLQAEDFQKPDQVIQLGRPPVRIDLVTSIEGVSWEQAVRGCVQGEYGGTPVRFLGRADLIANKKAAGRLQDLADVEKLEGLEKDTPADG
jgi:hypothetical protein